MTILVAAQIFRPFYQAFGLISLQRPDRLFFQFISDFYIAVAAFAGNPPLQIVIRLRHVSFIYQQTVDFLIDKFWIFVNDTKVAAFQHLAGLSFFIAEFTVLLRLAIISVRRSAPEARLRSNTLLDSFSPIGDWATNCSGVFRFTCGMWWILLL